MAVKDWSPEEQAEAKAAKVRRQGMTRPLRMRDLSRREQTEAVGLIAKKNLNIKGLIQKRINSAETPAPADVLAVNDTRLKPRNNSIRQMSNALVRRTESAAAGPERLPDEDIAGTGFYFDQRRPLAAATDDVHTLALASSRLSPKTRPKAEAKTAVALSQGHQRGSVTFSPELVQHLARSYRDESGEERPGVDVSEHLGKTVPFSQVDAKVVTHMRKAHNREAAYGDSQGVDWDGMRSVGLDANVARAHKVLQGDPKAVPNISQNPKQTGYAASISEATPGAVEDEYKFRAQHLGRVIRGEVHSGQTVLDTGLLHSNEGMLSNEAPIAGDTWTRRATSGQHLDVAGPVADTFISAKEDVGRGDKRVTPVGIEHAVQQAAVEGAARSLENKYLSGTAAPANMTETTREKYGLPAPAEKAPSMKSSQPTFTVPSRLIQETGGWAQPRREAGGDPEYNAARRDEAAAEGNRNVSQRQMHGQGALF